MDKNCLKVGDVVTEYWYTDQKVYDVVEVSKSGNKIKIRERKPILDEKPEMVPGGFCGVVTKQAKWHTEPDPNGHVIEAHYRPSRTAYVTIYGNALGLGDHYYHDYQF